MKFRNIIFYSHILKHFLYVSDHLQSWNIIFYCEIIIPITDKKETCFNYETQKDLSFWKIVKPKPPKLLQLEFKLLITSTLKIFHHRAITNKSSFNTSQRKIHISLSIPKVLNLLQ